MFPRLVLEMIFFFFSELFYSVLNFVTDNPPLQQFNIFSLVYSYAQAAISSETEACYLEYRGAYIVKLMYFSPSKGKRYR